MTQQAINTEPVVFVVDDDIDVREGLKSVLGSVGLRCEVFASPREFLQREAADTLSCLVLDVRLPGMSGLDFLAQLAGTHADIPTIFITGHGDIPMSVKAMKAGAVEFLTKPVREQTLLDAVRDALERDRVRREQAGKMRELQARFESVSPRERDPVPGHRRSDEQADSRRNEIERGNREGSPFQSHEEIWREVGC
jgi:FixJ family two-component response regulator